MSQQAGWYDDPQDGAKLRYWDGVQWSHHTAPRQKAGLDRSGQAQEQWDGTGRQQGYGYGQQGQGQPPVQGQQWPGSQMSVGYPQGGYPMQQGTDPRDVTPDDQRLARWWHRVAARVLDGLLWAVLTVAVIAPLVAPGFGGRYTEWALSLDPMSADPMSVTVPPHIVSDLNRITLTAGLLALLYEVVMVHWFGGSVGKLLTGLRVRLREEPGRLGLGPALLRAVIYLVPAQIPVIGWGYGIINGLWPVWDPRRQALHDKVARTNVVTRQRP